MSITISSSSSSSFQEPYLKLTIPKNYNHHNQSSLSFAIIADFNNIHIPLWNSKPMKPNNNNLLLLDQETISDLFINFIQAILHYGSNKNSPFIRFPKLDYIPNFSEIFNVSFFTLSFLVSIYEAPANLRSGSIQTLKGYLTSNQQSEASNLLMKLLGSNLEEQWMRSVNLGVTNWIGEMQETVKEKIMRMPCSLFSHWFSTYGLWKVQLYCPVIVMDIESSSESFAE
ncbi:hypothetical protein HN51_058587 [Arachis hypogaea]